MTQKQVEDIRNLLPVEADGDFMGDIRSIAAGELGDEYLVFSAERVTMSPPMQDLMDNRTRGRKVWAAYCTCTCCNESFYTRKVPSVDAIEMYYGDDGCMYTMDPEGGLEDCEVDPAGISSIQIGQGDECSCPYCGSDVFPISAKDLKGGRTKAVQVAQLMTIGEYAAVIYWLVQRHINETGSDWVTAVPRDAFVLTGQEKILHFIKGRGDGYSNYHRGSSWRQCRDTKDAWYKLYHDWQSVYNKKRGSVSHPRIPSLVGTTGEKTGLYEYWEQGGELPVEYLKCWKKWPAIENLVKEGLGRLIDNLITRDWEKLDNAGSGYSRYREFETLLDLSRRRPHEMLRLTKEEYRLAEKRLITRPGLEAMREHREKGFRDDGNQVLRIYAMDEGKTLRKLQQQMKITGDGSMDRHLKYLEKQQLPVDQIQILKDARDFAFRLGGGQPLTQAELWPRRLRQVHDRLAEIITAQENRDKAEEYQKGFDRVLEQCSHLEWTDGELCIRLPRSNEDLVREGKTLNHCVGGYGKRHSQGKNLIFFVRRYRRPERSYYTLNISMGLDPKEIQLHGYGNESHRDKQGRYRSHSIPKKVRDFCTRWENELLAPYCAERYKLNDKEKTA